MKKIIAIILVLIVFITLMSGKTSSIIIPNEAIRFRVIASSDNEDDQNLKKQIRDSLQEELYPKLLDSKSIEDARNIINNNIDEVDSNIQNVLNKNNSSINYTINYGINYFPEKEYKGITYKEGEYESLVVTLGEGNGKNWWCVLFPPLCLLEAEDNQTDEVEYKSFVKELIDKYF